MKLIFASHNQHKTKEIASIFQGLAEVTSLADIGFFEEILETGSSLEENAEIKADVVFNATNLNCFADDTGLLVEALNGAPGVYSARYAGPEKSADANNQKLLNELVQTENRNAKFVTIICLIFEGKKHFFKGELEGKIATSYSGSNGFGYDPIFIPNEFDRSLAEMSLLEKNAISHRAKAFLNMLDFLKKR
jgi:XTP/dITP diphosphohydrolase